MFHTMVVSLSRRRRLVALLVLFILLVGIFPFSMSASASSSTTSYSLPTWWAKYQRLLKGVICIEARVCDSGIFCWRKC